MAGHDLFWFDLTKVGNEVVEFLSPTD